MGACQYLKRIDISWNQLEVFPDALFSLKRIEALNIQHNLIVGAFSFDNWMTVNFPINFTSLLFQMIYQR